MNPRLRLCVTVCLTALCLAGCKFQAETRIGGDGAGELRTEVGFSAQERENLENQNESSASDDFCNTSGAAAGTTVTEEQRGDETWCVTTARFGDLAELRQLYEQKPGLHINRLEISDGTLFYDIDMDTSSEESNFSGFETITWTVVLPGQPVSHNGQQVDGNAVAWIVPPHSGTVNLRAESPAAAPLGIAAVVLGILALLALIVVIGISLRKLFAPLK